MARRTGLPEHIRKELPVRANAGVGLDPTFPTRVGDRTCTASVACRHRPSTEMITFVKKIVDYLHDNDARHVSVVQDFRNQGNPGALLLRWGGGVAAADVAEKFAVSRAAECGTPRLPSWLSLRVDDDFDLRWQPAY